MKEKNQYAAVLVGQRPGLNAPLYHTTTQPGHFKRPAASLRSTYGGPNRQGPTPPSRSQRCSQNNVYYLACPNKTDKHTHTPYSPVSYVTLKPHC